MMDHFKDYGGDPYKKAYAIAAEVRRLRPTWVVHVEYQACVSVHEAGVADNVWFGFANPTYGASLSNFDGEDMGYVETWLVNEAPAQVLAEGVVRELEAFIATEAADKVEAENALRMFGPAGLGKSYTVKAKVQVPDVECHCLLILPHNVSAHGASPEWWETHEYVPVKEGD